jgi:hypothetical protein
MDMHNVKSNCYKAEREAFISFPHNKILNIIYSTSKQERTAISCGKYGFTYGRNILTIII